MKKQISKGSWILFLLVCPVWLGIADEETLKLALLHQQVAEMNHLRTAEGLPPLKLNLKLCEAAEHQANEMAQMGQLTHQDRQGRGPAERVKQANYPYRALGEIVANAPSWLDALRNWLRSPKHREIMLSTSFYEVGVNIAKGTSGKPNRYWTAVFGRQEGVYPLIIENDLPTVRTPKVRLYVCGAEQAHTMRLSNDSSTWVEVSPPKPQLEWQLREASGLHTVWVDLQIKGKRYRSQDEIQLVMPNR